MIIIPTRYRELKKELDKQTSIFKKYEAAYNPSDRDSPLTRLNLSRMDRARQVIIEINKSLKTNRG